MELKAPAMHYGSHKFYSLHYYNVANLYSL